MGSRRRNVAETAGSVGMSRLRPSAPTSILQISRRHSSCEETGALACLARMKLRVRGAPSDAEVNETENFCWQWKHQFRIADD